MGVYLFTLFSFSIKACSCPGCIHALMLLFTHTHTHTHTNICQCCCLHTHTHTYTCISAIVYTHTESHTRSHTHARTCAHTQSHTHTHQCYCLHTHSHTQSHTHTQSHILRNRKSDMGTGTCQKLCFKMWSFFMCVLKKTKDGCLAWMWTLQIVRGSGHHTKPHFIETTGFVIFELFAKLVQCQVDSEEVLTGTKIPEGGGRERLYLTLHCHHQSDSCI